jgi:hypothetical protein
MRALRTLLAAGGVAALLLATALPGDAQVFVNHSVNPWTGVAYRNVNVRNPWTGRVGSSTTVHNPWTGTTVQGRSVHNPWTGRTVRSGAVHNPWTGQTHWGVTGGRRW